MKPGSLVMFDLQHPVIFGIIIRASKWTNSWGEPWTLGDNDKPYRWWEVLYGDKIIVKSETLFKLIG